HTLRSFPTRRSSDLRPAIQCSREEVIRQVWRQLKQSINTYGELLRDQDLHSWFLVRDNDLTVGVDDHLRLVLKKTAWYSFLHPRSQEHTSALQPPTN